MLKREVIASARRWTFFSSRGSSTRSPKAENESAPRRGHFVSDYVQGLPTNETRCLIHVLKGHGAPRNSRGVSADSFSAAGGRLPYDFGRAPC